MQARINYYAAAPDAFLALQALEQFVSQKAGLDPHILHLLKLRASQINECAYCVDMHTKEARKDGIGEQWINLISVWRESPVFDPRERALLAWTEAVTNITPSSVSDAVFEPLKEFFTDQEIVNLTVAIGMINVWNRMAISFRMQHPIDKN